MQAMNLKRVVTVLLKLQHFLGLMTRRGAKPGARLATDQESLVHFRIVVSGTEHR